MIRRKRRCNASSSLESWQRTGNREWLALARALDPVRLLKQVEQLQQAAFRCAVGVTPFPHRQPATPVLRFHEHLCQTRSFSRSQERPVERDPAPSPPETIDPLAWPSDHEKEILFWHFP